MYCPNCGKENSADQRYCRSCGLRLRALSQVLGAERRALKAEDGAVEKVGRELKGWQNPLVYGVLVIVLGLVISVLGRKVFSEQTITDVGTVTALIGAGLLGLKGFFLVVASLPQSSQAQPEPQAETTTPLAPVLPSAPPPSITEHTTKTLEAAQPRPPKIHE
jgi:zinc-ribbon domain